MLAAATGVGVAATELAVSVVAFFYHGIMVNHAASVLGFMLPRLSTMTDRVPFPWTIMVGVMVIYHDDFMAMPMK